MAASDFLGKKFSEYLRDVILGISVLVCSIPQHFSWFENYDGRWYPTAMHAPNLVNSSQDFHIGLIKIVTNLKNSWRLDI